MAAKTEEVFIEDVITKMTQFVYRSAAEPFDLFLQVLQTSSGSGNLNWHREENKDKIKAVFNSIATAVNGYNLEKGDFRSYMLSVTVGIIVKEYRQELINTYLKTGYNVLPESIINALDSNYSLPIPQNTNFPDVPNNSDEISPAVLPLIPNSLYNTGI